MIAGEVDISMVKLKQKKQARSPFLIFDRYRSPNLSRVLVMFHYYSIIQHFCWLTSPGGLRSESYQVASWEQWVHPKARTSK